MTAEFKPEEVIIFLNGEDITNEMFPKALSSTEAANHTRAGDKVFLNLFVADNHAQCYMVADMSGDIEIHFAIANGEKIPNAIHLTPFVLQKAMLSNNWRVVEHYPWEVVK